MYKELAIDEIYSRIEGVKEDAGLVKFKYAPTRPIELSDCPAVVMVEGVDEIIKKSSRGPSGTMVRIGEIVIEVICKKDGIMPTTIKSIYRQVRAAIFINTRPVPDNQTVVMEEGRKEGPMGTGIPDALVMRLVIELTYPD